VEVLTGDTLLLLPSGHEYDDESKLIKISLASIRAPRVGNERMGRPDEPFSNECKDRLRVLTVGKPATVKVAYERDIPLGEVSSSIEPNHHVCSVCCKIPSLPLALFVNRILKIVNSVSSL
jgi:hypothetical protein